MKQRIMPPLGREVATIVLGSVPFGTTLSDAQSAEILDAYTALGGNFIDTARVYGDFDRAIPGLAEIAIGKWLDKPGRRASVALATKGGHPPFGDLHASRLDRASVLADAQASLDALRTDHVDLYFLHRDDERRPVGDMIETLNELIGRGYARAIGSSNWSPARIMEANAYAAARGLIGFSVNQPRWSLARQITVEDDTLRAMDAETYRMHKTYDLPCMAYSSQAKGFFTKLAQGGEASLTDKARRRFLDQHNLALYGALQAIAARTGHTVGALALAYLTGQPFPTFPIVGVSRLSQVESLREAGDTELTPADRATLDALFWAN